MELSAAEQELLFATRHAVLATIRPDGRPRLIPCVFAAADTEPAVLYTPLDEKPKSVADPRELGRVRDIRARPRVSVLVERWSEDWTQLAWLRIDGMASLLEPGADEHRLAVSLLRVRYPQYRDHGLDNRPIIRIAVEGSSGWSAGG